MEFVDTSGLWREGAESARGDAIVKPVVASVAVHTITLASMRMIGYRRIGIIPHGPGVDVGGKRSGGYVAHCAPSGTLGVLAGVPVYILIRVGGGGGPDGVAAISSCRMVIELSAALADTPVSVLAAARCSAMSRRHRPNGRCRRRAFP